MLTTLKLKIESTLDKNNPRSIKIAKNVAFSLIVKGGSIIVALLLVPMTIEYINPTQYGLWITISSIVNWMSFFDVGLGNGLRNKLSMVVSAGDIKSGTIYVSTTYAILIAISSCIWIIFFIVNPFINWHSTLKVSNQIAPNLSQIILLVVTFFCLQFVTQLINTVLTAIQEPAKASILNFIGQIAVLLGVVFVKNNYPPNLETLVITLCGLPIAVSLVGSVIYYKSQLKAIAPSIKNIRLKCTKEIFSTGSAFFIIQIGALILFQTNNIIIARTLGPSAVTEFNVSYKLFSVVSMIFTIIIVPFWSGYTDAYVKKDFNWMQSNLKLLRKIWLLLSVLAVVITIFSPFLFKIWVGNSVTTDIYFSLAMMVYVISLMLQSIHVYILNGLGKVRIQLILVIIGALVNIPLTVFLGLKFGLPGIISANSVVILSMTIIFIIQTEKIIKQKAKGIWNK